MYIVIIGGGKVGHFLAKRLSRDKHTIVVIEKDKETCNRVAEELNDVVVIYGDGCEPVVLEEAKIDRADVVAAVTGGDEDNLVICQIAKEKYKVRRTVARVNDPKNEHTFSELGVDVPIDATSIIAKIIEEETSFNDFVNLMSFKRGKLAIVRVDLPQESPVINKPLQEITLPENSVVVSIIRGEDVVVPKGNTILKAQDDIIALTTIENEQQLLNTFLGKI